MKQYNRSGCPDSTGQQHIPYVEGRVDSVDNGIFIHAIVPRHVETVVLLEKEWRAGGVLMESSCHIRKLRHE